MAVRITDRLDPTKNPLRRYTVAEWLKMPAEPPYTELVDGVLQEMPNGTDSHSEIISNVRTALRSFVLADGLGRVSSEINVIIDNVTGENGWIPDVVFAAKSSGVKLGPNWLGAPTWVAEVWAAEEQKPSRIVEKRERWQRAGVPELWEIICGKKEQIVKVYRLDEQGAYQLVPTEGEQVCSRIIEGFCMEKADIFANLLEEE